MIDIYGREITITEVDGQSVYATSGLEIIMPERSDDKAMNSFNKMAPVDWVGNE